MNIVMVNPVHPSTPHVSAIRAWRFSQELAKLGHHVVLLTGDRPGLPPTPDDLPAHNWAAPFVMVCRMGTSTSLDAQSNAIRRRARTAVRLLRSGGARHTWVHSAVARGPLLRQWCPPAVVWCTCGYLESAFVARRLAADLACPWVLDSKDPWDSLVPSGLRRLMAWRLRGPAATTANARLTAEGINGRLGTRATVIYSGVDAEYFPSADQVAAPSDEFVVNLVGSTYFRSRLDQWAEGVARWFDQLSTTQRSKVCFAYLGADVEPVRAVVAERLPAMRWQMPGYLSAAAMAERCRGAVANAYIAHPATFHHKLLELIACRRPVLAFPGERQESLDLVARFGATLAAVETPARLATTLATLHEQWESGAPPIADADHRESLGWPARATELDHVLRRVAGVDASSRSDDR